MRGGTKPASQHGGGSSMKMHSEKPHPKSTESRERYATEKTEPQPEKYSGRSGPEGGHYKAHTKRKLPGT